jgi:coenzyme F420-reducing hydrogenase delta subunit
MVKGRLFNMRLRYMEKILSDNLKKLNINATGNPNNGSLVDVKGISETVDAIMNLKELEFLQNDIQEIEKIKPIFNSRIEPSVISTSDWNNFSSILNRIKEKSLAVLGASRQVICPQDENSISIKLPITSSLSEIKGYLELIDKAFNQAIVNNQIKGKVEIKNVDAGSIWFDIAVGCGLAVSLIGTLAWSAAVIRKKYYESEIIKELAHAQIIKGDMLDSLQKGIDKLVNVICEEEAKSALKELDVASNDNEFIERLKLTIKTFADLIDKGAEIQPSLTAPEEVTNLFPDFSKIDLIESRMKLLSTAQTQSNEILGNTESSQESE